MSTTYTVAPSQVVAKIAESAVQSGDIIKVVGTPTDDTINFPMNYSPNKAITLVCEQAQTYLPDPFNYAELGKPAKTWRSRAVSPVTITGTINQFGGGLSSGLFDFRNFNWKIPRMPDWMGSGETWYSMQYTSGALCFIRPAVDAGSNLRVYMEDIHFEGPREFTPDVTDGYGDCPSSYYLGAGQYAAMCRADGAKVAPFTSGQAGGTPWDGRGLWPGQSDYRNKRFDSGLGVDVLYNQMASMPDAVGFNRVRGATMRYCSFRNLGTGINWDNQTGQPFDGLSEYCWFENLYDDWIHGNFNPGGPQTEAATEFQLWRDFGSVFTGCGNLSGLDLGNPHVDKRQWFLSNGDFGPRLLTKNTVDDVGVQVGKPSRSSDQDFFGGGGGSIPQMKIYRCLNAGARNKSIAISSQSFHIEELQSLVVPTAPDPLDLNSAGLLPSTSANQMFLNGPAGMPATSISQGLVKNTNVASITTSGVNPRKVGLQFVAPKASVPASVAPDGNTGSHGLAASYAKYRQPSWTDDIVTFLNQAHDFTGISVVATPPNVEAAAMNATVTSSKERMHLGDLDSVGTFEVVTPGLQWAEYSYDRSAVTRAMGGGNGTVKDGRHIVLSAPAASTPATPKDYFYKVNGQLLKWTIVTAGSWPFPQCSKPATGQWQKTTAGALIPSATALQKQRGIILFRFSVQKPASPLTSVYWLQGSSQRSLQCQITTTDAAGYSLQFQWGNSTGGRIGTISSGGGMQYDTVYEAFYVTDYSLPSNNVGLVIRNATTGAIFKPWSTITEATTQAIAWDFSHAANMPQLGGNGVPLTLHCFALWAGSTLSQDDGTGSKALYDPGLQSPEALGYRFSGLNGTQPTVLLLGETTVNNRGSSSSAWSASATLTDVGGYSWANPGGLGPKMAVGFDDLPASVSVGDTITITAKVFGSNEPMAITPTLGSGLSLVGGPSFNIAENARTVSFQAVATGHGNKSVSLANSVNYNNPGAVSVPVGRVITFTVMPASGFTFTPYVVSVRFAP